MNNVLAYAAARALSVPASTTISANADRQDEPFSNEPETHVDDPDFEGLVPKIARAINFMLFGLLLPGILLLVSSIVTYSCFYYLSMPGNLAVEYLFFDYSGAPVTYTKTTSSIMQGYFGDGIQSLYDILAKRNSGQQNDAALALEKLSENFVSVNAMGDTSTTDICQPPCAIVDLFARHALWEARHPSVLPLLSSKGRILKAGQYYSLEVSLTLPESAVNRELGIFGVQVELRSHNGTKLALSTRSSRLPHQSKWVSVVRNLLIIVPLLLGATEEIRTVTVPAFRYFLESQDFPLRFVEVRLLGNRESSKLPEVLSGEVRLAAELNSFQLVLKTWFYTCSILGVAVIFIFEAAVLIQLQDWWREYRRKSSYVESFWDVDLNDPFYDISHNDADQWEEINSGNSSGEPGPPPGNTDVGSEAENGDAVGTGLFDETADFDSCDSEEWVDARGPASDQPNRISNVSDHFILSSTALLEDENREDAACAMDLQIDGDSMYGFEFSDPFEFVSFDDPGERVEPFRSNCPQENEIYRKVYSRDQCLRASVFGPTCRAKIGGGKFQQFHPGEKETEDPVPSRALLLSELECVGSTQRTTALSSVSELGDISKNTSKVDRDINGSRLGLEDLNDGIDRGDRRQGKEATALPSTLSIDAVSVGFDFKGGSYVPLHPTSDIALRSIPSTEPGQRSNEYEPNTVSHTAENNATARHNEARSEPARTMLNSTPREASEDVHFSNPTQQIIDGGESSGLGEEPGESLVAGLVEPFVVSPSSPFYWW